MLLDINPFYPVQIDCVEWIQIQSEHIEILMHIHKKQIKSLDFLCYFCFKTNPKVYKIGSYRNALVASYTWPKSALDYTTFGSSIPELQYAYSDGGDTSKYRFGFNTQERDAELREYYAFEYRIHVFHHKSKRIAFLNQIGYFDYVGVRHFVHVSGFCQKPFADVIIVHKLFVEHFNGNVGVKLIVVG